MKTRDFENKQFNRVLRGYDVEQVDYFTNKLLDFCRDLEEQNRLMGKKISNYERQEQYIQAALISAEEVSASIKANAEKEAQQIIESAKKEALGMIENTQKETELYRDNIHNSFYGHEKELRLIIDNFYGEAQKHMKILESGLTEEIEAYICEFDREYDSLPNLSKGFSEPEASTSGEDNPVSDSKENVQVLYKNKGLTKSIESF